MSERYARGSYGVTCLEFQIYGLGASSKCVVWGGTDGMAKAHPEDRVGKNSPP